MKRRKKSSDRRASQGWTILVPAPLVSAITKHNEEWLAGRKPEGTVAIFPCVTGYEKTIPPLAEIRKHVRQLEKQFGVKERCTFTSAARTRGKANRRKGKAQETKGRRSR